MVASPRWRRAGADVGAAHDLERNAVDQNRDQVTSDDHERQRDSSEALLGPALRPSSAGDRATMQSPRGGHEGRQDQALSPSHGDGPTDTATGSPLCPERQPRRTEGLAMDSPARTERVEAQGADQLPLPTPSGVSVAPTTGRSVIRLGNST